MKMKKVLLFILAFTVLSANAVNAKEGFYAGGNVTVNMSKVEDDKSTKPTVSIDLGYKFNFNSFTVAPELYFNLMSEVFKKDGLKLKEFGGLNVKFGYDIDSKLNTFFLVGVGYTDKPKFEKFDDTDIESIVAMNLGIGAEYEVMDNLNVNFYVIYSFGNTGDWTYTERTGGMNLTMPASELKYKNTKISLGANYYFGF